MMKKCMVLLLFLCFSTVFGVDYDLAAKKFSLVKEGKAEVVSGENLFSKALKLTAGNDAPAMAVYEQTFPFNIAWEYEVSTDIKGSGMAFIVLEILDNSGNVIVAHKIAGNQAAAKFRDLKGKFRGSSWRARSLPAQVRVLLGVEKNSSVIFDDVELEIDRD